jgi:hypothetical protein
MLSIITPGLCITEMTIAATHKVPNTERNKLGELHIRMRSCKTPKVIEGRSVDYVAIHAEKKGTSPYPPAACTPP